MALLQSSLYVFYESPSNGGKWIPANVSLYPDGKFEVKVPDEDKTSFVLTSSCSVHAPVDSLWNKVPTLPYRRSIKETFGLQLQKDFVTWFLTNSEEERNQWTSSITSVLSRKPPVHGDYDNWNYFHSDQPQTKLPKHQSGFNSVPKLPTLEPRAGFYSVENSMRRSQKDSNTKQLAGFYSVDQSARRNPNDPSKLQSSGFYSVDQSARSKPNDPSKLQSSGFYSVEQSSRRSSNTKLQSSGFYSVEQSARNSLTEPSRLNSDFFKHEPITKFPGSLKKTGFYSVQDSKGPTDQSVCKLKPDDEDDGRCRCCTSISACFCNIFALCCHQCCMNFASSI